MRLMLPSISTLAILASALTPARGQSAYLHTVLAQRAAALRAQWAAHPLPHQMIEPSLASGEILTPEINVAVAPGTPTIRLNIKPGSVGLFLIQGSLTSPNGQQSVSFQAQQPQYPPNPTRESLTIQVTSTFSNQGFGFYTEPGAWTLSNISLLAMDGTSVFYSAYQLAALFPSIKVKVRNHGTPDVTPPTIKSGTVLTPSISLSSPEPYFAAKFKVADNTSGVANLSMNFTAPNGAFGYGAYIELLAPVNKGKIIAAMLFQPGSPTGTYTIASLDACDVAGNCVSDTLPAEIQAILGTTTFQVTN